MTAILQESAPPDASAVAVSGLVELADGHAFIRTAGYRHSAGDVYVSRRARSGSTGSGRATGGRGRGAPRSRPRQKTGPSTGRWPRWTRSNGRPARLAPPAFDELTPVYPTNGCGWKRATRRPRRGSSTWSPRSARASAGSSWPPPKAGKTMVLQAIATAIANSHPEIKLMVVLVGERPEEVTELRRSIRGEVVYSTFDQDLRGSHPGRRAGHRARQAHGRGRRRRGGPARFQSPAWAAPITWPPRPAAGPSPAGVAASALQPPRRFLGAARNTEEAGSLTIVSTALVDTGSRLDDVLFEEFKGTGNMELRLRRELAEQAHLPGHRRHALRHPSRRAADAIRTSYRAVGTLRRAPRGP